MCWLFVSSTRALGKAISWEKGSIGYGILSACVFISMRYAEVNMIKDLATGVLHRV